MKDKRSLWLSLSLVNLCIVAFFGFTLRSKIVFSLPFVDYRNVLSAHSHFAFGGWAGLAIITLLVYDILPQPFRSKKAYQWILIGIESSSLGMALLFPFLGYQKITILFSDLYVVVSVIFVITFIRDVIKSKIYPVVRLLSIAAALSMLLSFLGTLGLAYIILSHSGNSILYRDSVYTFLHFQYNGFFTLSIFALLVNQVAKNELNVHKNIKRFSAFLCLSIIPALFLSLLWHNLVLFYVLAIIGCVFILLSLFFFLSVIKSLPAKKLFVYPLARGLWILSMCSFAIKMFLQVGTIFPQLGDAVYGARPIIIGFLHLVFLGFVTFFILSDLIRSGYFTTGEKIVKFPFFVFSAGIILNELLLGIQGLGILFKSNSSIFAWLLWSASIVLFLGALLIAVGRRIVINKKAIRRVVNGQSFP
jgi:hypothetical protein